MGEVSMSHLISFSKILKLEYLKNEKSFLDDIKKFFIVFKGLSFGRK